MELQRHYERLVRGLEGLLALGAARLARRPDAELHGRAQLQQRLAAHMVPSRRRRRFHSHNNDNTILT